HTRYWRDWSSDVCSSDLGLQQIPPERTDLRRTLATFMEERTPTLLGRWLPEIGRALGIPERDWPEITQDMTTAIVRWARHIADPENIETYVHLSLHTRRGF